MGPYYLSTLVTLLGPIASVQASGQIGIAERVVTTEGSPIKGQAILVETLTTLHALLEFASGAQVTFLASWDVWKHGVQPIELHGETASLRVPDPNWFGGTLQIAEGREDWRPIGTEMLPFGALNWPRDPFVIPDDILAAWRAAGSRGADTHAAWKKAVEAMPAAQRDEFLRRLRGELPAALGETVRAFKRKASADTGEIATRKASEAALEVLAPIVPELVLGSADLTGSNNNKVSSTPAISPGHYAGRFVHWGVREHGMAAAVNGMSLHSGFIPSGATFL
eukprot:gene35650-42151_t